MFAKLHEPTTAGRLEAVTPTPGTAVVRTQEGETRKCACSTASVPHPTADPTFSYVGRKKKSKQLNQPTKKKYKNRGCHLKKCPSSTK